MMENQNEIIWSPEEMTENAGEWSLAGDVAVLNYLKKFSEKVLTQTVQISDNIDQQLNSLNEVSLKLDLVKNEFHRLRNTQFIESRVYEDDETLDDRQGSEQKTQEALTEEQNQDRIKNAILRGVDAMKKYYDKVEVDVSDSEDDNEKNYILKPKDLYANRPLPYIVGTEEWHKKWHVGLLLSDSDTESEKEEEVYSSSDSDSALPKDRVFQASESSSELNFSITKNLGPAANSTFNDTVERSTDILHSEENDSQNSYPAQTPISNQNFAEQLAEKLGNVISADNLSNVNQHPIKKPSASNFFSDEPPPLDDFDETMLPKSSQKGLFSGGRDLLANDEEEDLFWKRTATQSDDTKSRSILSKSSKGLFDESDGTSSEEDMFEKMFKKRQETVKNYLPTPRSNLPPIIDDQPPKITPKTNENLTEKKKPIGGVSIFGENSNLFGNAPLKTNLQPSKTVDNQNSETESKIQKTVKKTSLFDQSDDEDITSEKQNNTSQKLGKKLSLFDESDDEEFTQTKPEKSNNIGKKLSLFDSDDDADYFSTETTNSKIIKAVPNKSSLFESDDKNISKNKDSNSFISTDKTHDTKSKVSESKIITKNVESSESEPKNKKLSLFDSENEEATSVLPSNSTTKPPKRYASIFDDEDDIFATTDDIFAKKSTQQKPSQIHIFEKINKVSSNSLFDMLNTDSSDEKRTVAKEIEDDILEVIKEKPHNESHNEHVVENQSKLAYDNDIDFDPQPNESVRIFDSNKNQSVEKIEHDKVVLKETAKIVDSNEDESVENNISKLEDEPGSNGLEHQSIENNDVVVDEDIKSNDNKAENDDDTTNDLTDQAEDIIGSKETNSKIIGVNIFESLHKENQPELKHLLEDGQKCITFDEDTVDEDNDSQFSMENESLETKEDTECTQQVKNISQDLKDTTTVEDSSGPPDLNNPFENPKINIFESSMQEQPPPLPHISLFNPTPPPINIFESSMQEQPPSFPHIGLFDSTPPPINIFESSMQGQPPPLPHIGLFDPTPPPIGDLSNDDSSDGFDSLSINEDYSHEPVVRQRSSFFDNEPPMLNPNESSGIVRDQNNYTRLDTDDSSFYPYASSSRRYSSDIFTDQQSQDSVFVTKNQSANALHVSDLQKIQEDDQGEDSSSMSKIDVTPSGNINDFYSDSLVFDKTADENSKGKLSSEDKTPKHHKTLNIFATSDEENEDFLFNSMKKSSVNTSTTKDEVDKLNSIKQSEKTEIQSENDTKSSSPPKKLKHNLQINVGALLPGAARPKVAKSVSFEDTEIKKDEEKRMEPEVNSGVLVSVTKDRARIPVKRRPSTRKGRQEAIRNSIADFRLYQEEEKTAEDTSNIQQDASKRISLVFEKNYAIPKDNNPSGDFSHNKNLSIYKVPAKSSIFDEDSSSDSEDLFKTASVISKNNQKPNKKSTPKSVEKTSKDDGNSSLLFSDDELNKDSDTDLFGGSKIRKQLTDKPRLFDNSDQGTGEEDLFGGRKTDFKASTKSVDRRPVKTATVKKLENKKVDGDDPLQAL